MEEKMLKPILRFKSFTDTWKQFKLGDLGFFKSNGVDKLSKPSEIPVNLLNYMDVYNRREVSNKNAHELMRVTAKPCQLIENNVQKNDVFFTPTSETPEDIGRVYVIEETLNNTVYSYHLMRFRPNQGTYYPNFPNYSLMTENVRKQFFLAAKGVQRYVVSKADFESIKDMIPEYREQEKIGEFFRTIDQLITLHQRKYDKLVNIKKALLDNMFPINGEGVPKLRFKGFTDTWEQCKLSDISNKIKEKNADFDISETFTNSAEYGIVSQRDFFNNDVSNPENISEYYVVKNNDFVYNPRISSFAPFGPINRNKLGRSGVMSPLYYVFRTHDVENSFLERYFETSLWHRFLKINGDTGARNDRLAIKDSVLVKLPIWRPNRNEQIKIGYLFDNLDSVITLHQCKYDKLVNIKKALLQKMFV